MVDRGLLNYDDKISKHWPQFAKKGKQDLTVADVLRHVLQFPIEWHWSHFTLRCLIDTCQTFLEMGCTVITQDWLNVLHDNHTFTSWGCLSVNIFSSIFSSLANVNPEFCDFFLCNQVYCVWQKRETAIFLPTDVTMTSLVRSTIEKLNTSGKKTSLLWKTWL